MYRTKQDVDRHVSSVLARIKDEKEVKANTYTSSITVDVDCVISKFWEQFLVPGRILYAPFCFNHVAGEISWWVFVFEVNYCISFKHIVETYVTFNHCIW